MVQVRIDAVACSCPQFHVEIEIDKQNTASWLLQLGELAATCHTRGCRRPSGHQGPHYFNADDAAMFGGVP